MPIDVQIDDIVEFRKPHPCGSKQWRVYRVGSDIGVQCLGCQRRQLLPRRKFEKAFKRKLAQRSDQ
jgi:hypothetical protein